MGRAALRTDLLRLEEQFELEEAEHGIVTRIRDGGEGFVPERTDAPDHLSLVAMRERARAAGGRFSLTASPGRGTVVDCWVPRST